MIKLKKWLNITNYNYNNKKKNSSHIKSVLGIYRKKNLYILHLINRMNKLSNK